MRQTENFSYPVFYMQPRDRQDDTSDSVSDQRNISIIKRKQL